jgi:hypothetical protein
MSKVTSKSQVTVSEVRAERSGIRPDTEVVPPSQAEVLDVDARLELFDEATRRQRARETGSPLEHRAGRGRGWSREELYERRGAD